jgi:hypothetical protein
MLEKQLFISYADARKFLNLSVEDFKYMLKVFDINCTPTKFSKEQMVQLEK